MLLVANLLLAVSALGILSIPWSRTGPEGPVGIHMITLPLALLQAGALAIAFHQGFWQLGAPPGWLFYVLLAGFVVAVGILPVIAMSGPRRGMLRWAVVVCVLGTAACVNGRLVPGRVLGSVGGAVVGLVALAGWAVLGTLFVEGQRNALRQAAADAERISEFEANQRAHDLEQFGKLPAPAELWQLIPFTHSFHPDVQQQCRARIAALPDLEGRMKELLGTGWAEHALRYLDDCYPLPYAPLAPEFARFLDQECESWRTRLLADHAGTWGANISRHFAVAAKIQAGGGDLRPQLRRWLEVVSKPRGHHGLAQFIRSLL